MTGTPLTYWDYIKLDTIQALQSEHQTDCYDEIMFIAVHQHFEFWFAQVIRDLREIIRRLRLTPPEIASGTALLHRCNIEFRLATQGFEVLKTLPRESFLAFRAALQHASGLQSVQFTIIELLVGRTAEQLYHHLIRGPGMRDFLDKYGGPDSLLARVLREVERTGNLRQNYDRLASFTASDQLSALEQELVTLDRQLFDWRRHHAETAAHVLGGTSASQPARSATYTLAATTLRLENVTPSATLPTLKPNSLPCGTYLPRRKLDDLQAHCY